MTLHVICLGQAIGGRLKLLGITSSCQVISLIVINCICETGRKRTPVSVLYTGYELSVVFFFFKCLSQCGV